MGSYSRLIPFFWPYRKALLVSVFYGLLVAVFWGCNLSFVFPVVNVLVDGHDLHQYVAATIERNETESKEWQERTTAIDGRIAQLKEQGRTDTDPAVTEEVGDRVRADRKRNEAATRAWRWTWVQHAVLPWVPHGRFETLAFVMGLLLVATILKGVFLFLQDVIVGRCVQLAMMGVRKEALRRTLFLDYPALSAHGAPGLMSRFTYDTEQIALGMNMVGAKLVREPLKFMACVLCAFLINWRLTLLSIVCAPVIGFFFIKYGRSVKKASRRMAESMSRLYRILEETFEGIRVVVAFDTASRHRTEFHHEYKTYLAKSIRLVRIDAIAKPISEVLVLVALFMALLPATYLVLSEQTNIWGIKLASDRVDFATLSVLYAMLAGMLDPCRKMSNVYSRLRKSAVSIERVFELIDQRPAIHDPIDPLPMPTIQQSVEFDNVCFTYPSATRTPHRGPVLNHLHLTIPAGEVVAIVGQNGCGKSTLMNLLPRFYDPDSGEIRLDGIPLKDVRLSELRHRIGLVTQDTILFEGTVRENIAYGSPHASDFEIRKAAEQAYVTPILEKLPQGLDSRIGEKGRDLSGGQRQRVALARAMVRNPSLLILDEATSAADNESEMLIHRALKDFARGRTVLMITHSMNPSLLEFVTRIVVMDEGRVLATGTHAELLQSCALYCRLFQSHEAVRVAA